MSNLKTAFDAWLSDSSKGDPVIAAAILYKTLMNNPAKDNIVWELLEQTGIKEYSLDAFVKAAKICLDKPDNPRIVRGK